MPEFHALGQSRPLIDGRAKVAGDARYAADMTLPGMLHARPVLSLYAHAEVLAIDARAALALPGVTAVLTAHDLPDLPPASRSRLLLARGRVIFAGQPVALVLAESEAAAEDGALAVRVDYAPLPAAVTIDQALAEGAPLVWPGGVPDESGAAGQHGADAGESERQAGSNLAGERTFTRGDAAAAWAEADVVVERTFTTSMVHQSSLETQTVLARYEPATGGATLWVSTQGHFDVRQEVAQVLDVPETDVRVFAMTVGGAFGGKFGLYEPLAALAARAVGRPVRLALTRTEEMLAANPAPAARIHARLGARRDGRLTGLSARLQLDNGCYPMGMAGFMAFMLGSFYRVPHLDLKAQDVLTFKTSAGFYRAPGAPVIIFALDSLIDEAARQLGLDPLEMRLLNAVREGDPMADGDPWPAIGMCQTLEALRDHPAWREREKARAAGRGVGVAVGGWPGGVEPAAAVCGLQRDGRLQIQIGSVDLNGTATGMALLAAEAFGMSPDQVQVVFGDTASAPYSGATGGSKVTYTTGAAVAAAAREARQQALSLAAEMLEAAVEDLDISPDGRVEVRGAPGRGLSLSEIAKKTMRFGGRYAPVLALGRVATEDSAPAFCAQLAEVEVDPDTGEIRVCRLVMVQDVGRAINPAAIQGQMLGGAAQGVGWALYEKMGYDANGQLLSANWLNYAVPGIGQVAPEVEALWVEVPSANGPFGVRGVGEAPVVATAAAVANAIADLTGLRLTGLPMTAPDVLRGLQARA